MTLPGWLRGQIIGLPWAGFMYAQEDDGPRTVMQAVVYLGGGVAFGVLFHVLIRKQERRLFGDLTDAGRAAALDAVRAGRPPDDPRLREAANRVAANWARPKMRPRHQAVVFGLFLLLSVYVALTVSPWAWLLAAFWPPVAWNSIRTEQRQRTAAERFLRGHAEPGTETRRP